MKRTLIALLATAFIASCGQGGNEAAKTEDTTAVSVLPEAPPCDQGIIEAPLIPFAEADTMIQRYHRSIGLKDNPNQNVSFQLDANSLRCALNGAPNISKLDIYLAQGNDGKMTLVYVGAYDSSGYTVEHTYVKQDGTQWVMDQVYPCPTCLKIGIHTPPTGQ
jgi:hypothetical protein